MPSGVWSLYGAPWLQPVANGGKCPGRRNRKNRRKGLPWIATGCVRRSMVSRASAVGCHPLREVPSLRGEGVDAYLARLCAPISSCNPGTGTGRNRSRCMPGGSWRDDTHGFPPRSVGGSSRSAAPPGADGRGRRGSLTPMSGGGSSREKSPQRLVRPRRRRKSNARANHRARSRLQVRMVRSLIVRRRALPPGSGSPASRRPFLRGIE
jgi:hypothetical protein